MPLQTEVPPSLRREGVFYINVQLKKGVLDMLVLAMLIQRDHYGFEMVSGLSGTVAMAEGTVYPLLKRLRDEGLLTTYLKESTEGPPRKYYRITDIGRTRFDDMASEWREMVESVNRILDGGVQS